ncbi:MAG TPA: hypothetical protein VFY65_00805 [Longimicrobium sp.]|nr:hypothetical protein [Longimicrobium sp.]
MKLKLQLDDLRVDSFDTTAVQKAKGTVFGEQCTCWTQCGQNTCPGCPSCNDSCPATCAYSCDDHTCGGYTCAGYNTCNNTCRYVETCQRITECGQSGDPYACPW